MKKALLRLFLILFPLSLLGLAFFLMNQDKLSSYKKNNSLFQKRGPHPVEQSNCPLYYGFSFFPLTEKRQNFFNHQKDSAPFISYLLSKQNFLKKVQDVKTELKKQPFSLKKILWEFPLVFTKDKKWLISKKSFFILPTGERKEFSHLSVLEITKQHKNFIQNKQYEFDIKNQEAKAKQDKSFTQNKLYTPLTLSKALSFLPESHFLFLIEGSHKGSFIESLKSLPLKNLKAKVYFSSSNEKLLQKIALTTEWQILHSFKSLAQWQILKIFQAHSWKEFLGLGFLLPPAFSFPLKDLSLLKRQNKLFFLKKDPPYDLPSQKWIQKSDVLISSKPIEAWPVLKKQKPCFMEK